MNFKMIVAMCNDRGIGYENSLPWNYSTDIKYFSKMTKGEGNNAVIMGRSTYESIGRPLIGRKNLILSTTLTSNNRYLAFNSVDSVLQHCKTQNFDEVWVIGGESIYKQFLNIKNLITEIYTTEIANYYKCDTFFPDIYKKYKVNSFYSDTEHGITLLFSTYSLINGNA